MTDWIHAVTHSGVSRSLDAAQSVIRQLQSIRTPGSALSIATEQAFELSRYLQAWVDELQDRRSMAAEAPQRTSAWRNVVTRQTELDAAIEFVVSGFLQPRLTGALRQPLEAADWHCFEAWNSFCRDTSLICPIVAVNSSRSPAVWDRDAAVPVPTLFSPVPGQVRRAVDAEASERALEWFPIVCLPTAMARSPEFYPLLSHEVGHAVDAVRQISTHAADQISGTGGGRYWNAWMRELVADLVGLLTSGTGFTIALESYTAFMQSPRMPTWSHSYPPMHLRLAFLDCLAAMLTDQVADPQRRVPATERTAQQLLQEFQREVAPVLLALFRVSESTRSDWLDTQRSVDSAARCIADGGSPMQQSELCAALPFSALPSIVTQVSQLSPRICTSELFRDLHHSRSAADRPKWVRSPSQWRFSEGTLRTMRATELSVDGRTKVPPRALFSFHDQLVLVGATHGQLLEHLEAALRLRNGEPWTRVELYFADDEAIDLVERESDSGAEIAAKDLRSERNRAEEGLKTFLSSGAARDWTIAQFRQPLIFGAWLDHHQPGGRVHVSVQLLGTCLRTCPGWDYVWSDGPMPAVYAAWVRHLGELTRRAQTITQSSSHPAGASHLER